MRFKNSISRPDRSKSQPWSREHRPDDVLEILERPFQTVFSMTPWGSEAHLLGYEGGALRIDLDFIRNAV
jgi:hypothetical protein